MALCTGGSSLTPKYLVPIKSFGLLNNVKKDYNVNIINYNHVMLLFITPQISCT